MSMPGRLARVLLTSAPMLNPNVPFMSLATPSARGSKQVPRTLRAGLARACLAASFTVTVGAATLLAPGAVLAQPAPQPAATGSTQAASSSTPVGQWRTIDDTTGKPRGLIEINEHDGVLSGRLVRSLEPEDGPPKLCTRCTDARRDQPIIGMTLITGLRKTGDNEWSGGEILDPESGKLYKTKLSLADNGTRLNVRGFIGISLLGRTQTWERVR